MSFFNRKKNKENIIVFDIGSASIGGAIVNLGREDNSDVPEIIYSTRENIVFQENLNFHRFLSSMLQALKKIMSTMESKTLGKPKAIFCTISSPWYTSQTRIIRIKKTEPFILTEDDLEELMKKEVNLFKKTELKKHPQLNKENIKIIENKNIQIKLNGYETSNPFNKKTKEAKIISYLSVSTEEVINKITENIQRVFNTKNIYFNSFTTPFFSTIRDIFKEEERFLLVDISGEITDITMVKDNSIFETTSFPLGKNFLLRRLTSGLKTVPSEALSLLVLYLEKKGSQANNKKIEKILMKARQEWLKEFQKSLHIISQSSSLSGLIFLITDQEVMDWFSQIIREEEFHQYTLTEKPFEIISLSPEIFHDFLDFNGKIEKDEFLMLETIFANKIYKTF